MSHREEKWMLDPEQQLSNHLEIDAVKLTLPIIVFMLHERVY